MSQESADEKRHLLLIHGYIRKQCDIYNIMIPLEVKNICFKLFYIMSPDAIRKEIDNAIDKQRIIWISYNGHQRLFIPHPIKPITW